ncbi:putative aldouronate transport system permease protein [Anaerocolumna jejuensis DSM 15929]|uniref:Putative aldouronate transport system permease protein n=1 Tax=Anaerocolumna jejuensis DSM 15929 TaxID=1121322 RepID=A0A1M6P226_9FIRM|nr:carbohydrate ABC transporter permease [Anaerocolumna jejuensis]SHK01922.1 putative aldouronate transport system permease protein [Anaerocolumna jejuensis DSM 15929]
MSKYRKKSIGGILADFIIWIVIILFALACLLPLVNTVAVSFSNQAAATGNIVWFWPVGFNLASYSKILEDAQFWRSFFISVLRVVLGTALNLTLVILMAYPLSKAKNEFRQRDKYMMLLMIAMLFSGGTIPLYITVKNLHLLNSIWALILPHAVPVFDVILMMNFFKAVPKSLDEAATVDGATVWQVLLKIYLPVSLPAIATITLFCIVTHWNDYFSGLIYINTATKYPLQTYIQQLTVNFSEMYSTNPEMLEEMAKLSNRAMNSAKIVVSTVPLLLIYPFLQRYFVTGIVMGSVKE